MAVASCCAVSDGIGIVGVNSGIIAVQGQASDAASVVLRQQSFGGNGARQQDMDAIGESVGLLASVGGVRFAENHPNIVVSGQAQIGESPDDRTPMSFYHSG
ncbi:MAG: hypothetical protein OXF79_17805 [Chloroflexi bacterium]|nr:hypothetical protein [Chloroflexota bacterium]